MAPGSLSPPALSRRALLGFTGAAALGGLGLSGCGVDRMFRGREDGLVTWGSWANPGEAKRFYEFNDRYTEQTGVAARYQTVVGDYTAKTLTQLAGRAAPDAFYVSTEMMPTLIQEKQVLTVNDYLQSAAAATSLEDYFPGLVEWCKDDEGLLYGLPVDCNPLVIWFNSDILAEAGAELPADQYAAGRWNLDALTDMLAKVKATGKRGLTFDSGFGHLFSWITTFGGTLFEDGKPVFHEDPIAKQMIGWIFEQLEAETITYGGSLPEGQGGDQLFFAQQLASYVAGRWVLPNLKELEFNYNIVPFPTENGGEVMPANVACAALGVNARAVNPEAALDFFGAFLNADGQRFRLSGGGNAVPSMEGIEEVVTEGNLPANGALFLECAQKGYAVPREMLTDPRIGSRFGPSMDELMKSGSETSDSLLVKLAEMISDPERLG